MNEDLKKEIEELKKRIEELERPKHYPIYIPYPVPSITPVIPYSPYHPYYPGTFCSDSTGGEK